MSDSKEQTAGGLIAYILSASHVATERCGTLIRAMSVSGASNDLSSVFVDYLLSTRGLVKEVEDNAEKLSKIILKETKHGKEADTGR